MPGSHLGPEPENRRRDWSLRLDRTFLWLPFDWRLLAPFFFAGAAAGLGYFLWLFYLSMGAMG